MLVVKATCTLTRTGQVEAGVHVFELMLEDFPTTNITLTYADGTRERRDLSSAPLCRVKLQFSVEGEEGRRGRREKVDDADENEPRPVFLSQSFLRSGTVGRVVRCPSSCLRLLLTSAFFTLPWVRSSSSPPPPRRPAPGTSG